MEVGTFGRGGGKNAVMMDHALRHPGVVMVVHPGGGVEVFDAIQEPGGSSSATNCDSGRDERSVGTER